MRRAFIDTLTSIANDDERIFLLTADLGYGIVEQFADAHPGRFINVGCAEQNMVGIAMGMASRGLFPFCYSIATFLTMRPFEFTRHAAHDNLSIRLVGIGRGKEYTENGHTHWALEAPHIMSCLPNMVIKTPTHDTVRDVLRNTWDAPAPVYYSLSRYDKP